MLPDFTGSSQSYVQSWAANHGTRVTVKETTGSVIGRVVNQNLPSGMDVDYVSNLTIYVVTSTVDRAPVDEPEEDPIATPTPTPDEEDPVTSPTPTPPTPTDTPDGGDSGDDGLDDILPN
ncbi:MAG: hypothetical protein HFG15_01965 [Bacilli bacterium]|nr:hypothetical protein [Bacilli bacterium]